MILQEINPQSKVSVSRPRHGTDHQTRNPDDLPSTCRERRL